MNMSKWCLAGLMACVGLGMASTAVQAGVVTQSFTFDPGQIAGPFSPDENSASMPLNLSYGSVIEQFSPELGVLDSIELTFVLKLKFAVNNSSDFDVTAVVTQGGAIKVGTEAVGGLGNGWGANLSPFTSQDIFLDLMLPTGYSVVGPGPGYEGFIGTGTTDLMFEGGGMLSVTTGGVGTLYLMEGSGMTVTYNFSAIPEPGVLGLLVPVAGLVTLRRR